MRLGDIIDRLMPIVEDAHAAELLLGRENTQFSRRAYVRSVFSMIEATLWILKQAVLQAVSESTTLRLRSR